MRKKNKDLLPLTPLEITRAIEDAGFPSLAEFARQNDLHYWSLISVIQRDERIVRQDIREFLADFLKVDVARVGREPKRPAVPELAPAA